MSWKQNEATSQKLHMLLSLLPDLFGRLKCPNLSQASPVHELMRHPAVRKLLRTMHNILGAILSQRFPLPYCSSDPFPFYPSLRRREGGRRSAPSGRELSNPLSVSPSIAKRIDHIFPKRVPISVSFFCNRIDILKPFPHTHA